MQYFNEFMKISKERWSSNTSYHNLQLINEILTILAEKKSWTS
jgi:hypothetical protein